MQFQSHYNRFLLSLEGTKNIYVSFCENIISFCAPRTFRFADYISEKQLYRIFKKHLGITITEYIRKVRLEKAAQLLTQKYFTISEVAYMVGFSSPSYFSKCFQEHYGTAPSTYQT